MFSSHRCYADLFTDLMQKIGVKSVNKLALALDQVSRLDPIINTSLTCVYAKFSRFSCVRDAKIMGTSQRLIPAKEIMSNSVVKSIIIHFSACVNKLMSSGASSKETPLGTRLIWGAVLLVSR